MLARLRPLFFLLLPFSAAATHGTLFTSSVTYCEPPETLLIQQFDLQYIAQNQSIFFNISAASVESNVTVEANILLNVYGMRPVNVTIDLCKILAGALCPLPKYEFVGSQSVLLPDSLGVANRIPEIAFHIPDLEAFAQLTLTDIHTHEVKACVQATLSNGWSTRQSGVEWVTAALAFFALLVALWQSTRPHAVVPHRLLDLLHFYQTIATTGLLSLNYPSLYRAFTVNFAWAIGLISSPHSKMQASIDNMRALTGGNMANSSASSAVGLVNRKLSPWNTGLELPPSYSIPQSLFTETLAATVPNNFTFSRLSLGGIQQLTEVQTVTDTSSNVLQAGIPIYVNSIHIATANAFMTVFLVSLIITAAALFIAGLLYAVLHAAGCFRWMREELRQELKSSYPAYVRSWAFRLGLVIFLPIMVFSFYQWTLKDSWLSIFLSVLAFLSVGVLVAYPVYRTLRLARRESPESFEDNYEHLAAYGPLFSQYRTPRFYFFLPLLIATFVKAVVIAAGQGRGLAQVIIFLIVEFALLVAHILLKPSRTKRGDIFLTYLSISRLICTGLMIAFVESIGVAAIPRVAIGVVIIVIFSVAVIVLAFNLIFHCVVDPLWRRVRSHGSSGQRSADASILEKGSVGPIESKTSPASHSRPSSRAVDDTSTARHSVSASILSQTVHA